MNIQELKRKKGSFQDETDRLERADKSVISSRTISVMPEFLLYKQTSTIVQNLCRDFSPKTNYQITNLPEHWKQQVISAFNTNQHTIYTTDTSQK